MDMRMTMSSGNWAGRLVSRIPIHWMEEMVWSHTVREPWQFVQQVVAQIAGLGYNLDDKTACRFSLPTNRRLFVGGLPERASWKSFFVDRDQTVHPSILLIAFAGKSTIAHLRDSQIPLRPPVTMSAHWISE